MSVDGSSEGDGSINNPWDLQTALNHPASVLPGDTIWLRGGTYNGRFTSMLTGSVGAPILVRAYPGENVKLDGNKNLLPQILVLAGKPWGNPSILGSAETRERQIISVSDPFVTGDLRIVSKLDGQLIVEPLYNFGPAVNFNYLHDEEGYDPDHSIYIIRNNGSDAPLAPEHVIGGGNGARLDIGLGSILRIEGGYAWFWDIEVMNSDSKRVTTIEGSGPWDIDRGDVNIIGNDVKLINCVIHDTQQGISAQNYGENSEVSFNQT